GVAVARGTKPKAADRRARIAVPPAVRALELRLEELATGGEPIVAGPWTRSVELELLYWIPFLRWFASRSGVTPDRLAAVSRAGAESWYAGVCATYAASTGEVSGSVLSPSLPDALRADSRQDRGPLVGV